MCALFQFLRNTRRRRWLLQFTPKIEKFLFQDLPPLLFAEHNNELGYKIASQNVPWVLLQHLFKRQFVFLSYDQNRSTDLSENHPTWKLLGVPKNYVHFRREMRKEVKRNKIHTRNLFTLAAKKFIGEILGNPSFSLVVGMEFRARNIWSVIPKNRKKIPQIQATFQNFNSKIG